MVVGIIGLGVMEVDDLVEERRMEGQYELFWSLERCAGVLERGDHGLRFRTHRQSRSRPLVVSVYVMMILEAALLCLCWKVLA